jgi:hypothetical protein
VMKKEKGCCSVGKSRYRSVETEDHWIHFLKA